jgi:hypothetical protein
MTAAPKHEPKGFFRFKAEMDDAELDSLCETLGAALDVDISLEEAQGAQSRIQDYVASMEGRVGEGIDDLLALWFARRAVALHVLKAKKTKSRPKVNSFEIGALFGGSGGTSIMAVEDLKITHRLVVIDPLDGYYGQAVDPVTGASVDPETLAGNFARAGAEAGDFEIIQGLSQDPEIIARANRFTYASGYIDGDHTLIGIHNDWFEYTRRIQLGGYCIVDNYNDPTSLEVSHFMDNVVLAELADYWTPVLTLGQTIIMRKDAEPPLELHRRLAGSINLKALHANTKWRDDALFEASRELGERRKQVQIRNDKIDRLESDAKRLTSERDLIAEKARTEKSAELAPKLAELEKALATRLAELKAVREARAQDQAALETARTKAQHIESQMSEQAAKSAELEKSLATRLAEIKAVKEARSEDQAALETARMKVQRIEAEMSEQAAQLAAAKARSEADADRITALGGTVEEVRARRAEERAALKEALEESKALRARAEQTETALDDELDALRASTHQGELDLARLSERLEARDRELEAARRDEAEAEAAASQAKQQADTLDRQIREQDGVIRELQFKVQQAAYEADQHRETRETLEAARAELDAGKDKNSRLRAEKTELDARLNTLRGEAAELRTQLGALTAERDRLASEGELSSQRADALAAELAETEIRRAAAQDGRDNEALRADTAEGALKAARAELDGVRASEAALGGEIAELAARLEALTSERDRLASEGELSSERAAAIVAELADMEALRAAAQGARDNEALRADSAERALKTARAELERLRSSEAALGGQTTELTARLDALTSQRDRLAEDGAQSLERATRSEAEMGRARARIEMLVKSDEAKAAELRTVSRGLEGETRAREAAVAKSKALEGELTKERRRATVSQDESDAARSDAEAMRAHAALLEERLHLMEAQAVAPRILLRRLAKAGVVRSLEIAGAIVPGKAGRSMKSAASRLRRTSAAPGLPEPAAQGLPLLPATPEAHDAGPPQHDLTFFVNYTFGGKTRYLPRTEFLEHTLRSGRAMRSLKGAFKGERCFVMGNGPSLNQQNLKQLAGEFTIGANYIYMNKEKMGFSPTLISFANYLVIQQRIDEILGLEDSVKTLPFYLFDDFGAPKDTLIINMQHQTPEFSLDATSYASTQSTVTYVNLQLAYYLGFDEVCLIGCDNRYVQPKHGREGTVLTQEEDDPNHFTPAYFKGLKWQKGDTVRIEQLYTMAGQAFEDRGSKIVDCTHNGALEVFEKKDLDAVVRQKPAPADALIERAKTAFRDVSRNPGRFEPNTVIVTISPDLADKFGHHYNMDAFLRDKAHEAGQELVSMCSTDVDRQLADHGNWLIPAFSVKSWHSRLDESVVSRKRRTFESELRKGLAVVMGAFSADTKFVLYMYTGNLPLAKSLASVCSEFDNVNAHVHHFYAAMTDMEDETVVAESTRYINDIQKLDAELYLGTYELVSYFKQKTGAKLNYLGDPSVTFDDGEVTRMIAETSGPRAGIQGPARVFFPPNMNVEKGYRTVLDAAEAILGSEDLKGLFKPILRYVPRENTPAQLTRRAEAIMEMTGGEVLDGVLSDDAFKSVTLSADIIAITYTVKAFSRRMSGSLTDALMTAKPIVATRGTYVGDQVERFGCGEVFDEGDVEGLIAGLKKIRDDYPRYHAAAIAARRKYFKERSWDALHRRLTQ